MHTGSNARATRERAQLALFGFGLSEGDSANAGAAFSKSMMAAAKREKRGDGYADHDLYTRATS